ncbi:MAG: hypothetical protein AAF585_03795 [Verrucomicrobiota bacterium]
MANVASAQAGGDDYKALVCFFFAGGWDSFNVLTPNDASGYAEYNGIRSDLALPQNTLLPLNGSLPDGRTLGVHASMPEVQNLYNSGSLAFISNVGTLVEPVTLAQYEAGNAKLPLGLFSHSDQIAHWQTSIPDQRSAFGWGGRMADILDAVNQQEDISMNISMSGTNVFQTGNVVTPYSVALPNAEGDEIDNEIFEYQQPGEWWAQFRAPVINSMLEKEYQNIFEQTYRNTITQSLRANQSFDQAIAA